MAGRESHAAVPASGRPFGRPTALRLAPLALHHLLDVPTHRQLALRKDADRELAPVRRQRVFSALCFFSSRSISGVQETAGSLRTSVASPISAQRRAAVKDCRSMSMGETRDAQLLGAACSRAKHVRLSETQIWESPIRDAKNLACE